MGDVVDAYPLEGKRIWVAGHSGMVGSALRRRLATEGCDVLTVDRATADLRRQSAVEDVMETHRPHAVIVAAATVGGILANDTRPAEFIYDNLAIITNIIDASHRAGVEKLVYLASSCVYPKFAEQPMQEAALLEGPVEPTNQWYAMAKIAGIKLCQAYCRQYGDNFFAAIPTNLYGPGDTFDPEAGHVVPALIYKVHQAKKTGGQVEIWGTGKPRREFLFVDDAADALVFLLRHYSGEDIINVGGGDEVSVRELAEMVADVMGYRGDFICDTDKPDGMPHKSLEAGRMRAMGWQPKVSLRDGLETTCRWYRENGEFNNIEQPKTRLGRIARAEHGR